MLRTLLITLSAIIIGTSGFCYETDQDCTDPGWCWYNNSTHECCCQW